MTTTNVQRRQYLPFENEILEIDAQIRKLSEVGETYEIDLNEELAKLQTERSKKLHDIYTNLTPWQRVQVARSPSRPQTLDYIERMCSDFVPLAGDRAFADDAAIVAGLATIDGHRVMLVGQHKGRDVTERAAANSGCPHPEGYRKALRKMKIAEKFGLPVVTLIDTKGAYPGIGAEARGQSLAIAENLLELSRLRSPIVCVVIGEGGSGGALAIGVGDSILMLEYAYYSVISPEGCASILWKDAGEAPRAADALKLTAPDLLGFGLIDRIVKEPDGSASADPDAMSQTLKAAIIKELDALAVVPMDELVSRRYHKIRAYGKLIER